MQTRSYGDEEARLKPSSTLPATREAWVSRFRPGTPGAGRFVFRPFTTYWLCESGDIVSLSQLVISSALPPASL